MSRLLSKTQSVSKVLSLMRFWKQELLNVGAIKVNDRLCSCSADAAFSVRGSLWRNIHLIWVLVKANVWNFYFTVKYQFQNHSLTYSRAVLGGCLLSGNIPRKMAIATNAAARKRPLRRDHSKLSEFTHHQVVLNLYEFPKKWI